MLLINMPFGLFDMPALGLGLLKASLEERGIGCDVRYLSIPFAEIIGAELYLEICITSPRYLIGERIFTHTLFGRDRDHELTLFDDLPDDSIKSHFPKERVDELFHARDSVDDYLNRCMDAIPWDQYQIVGFSSTFQQNVASLALAQRIKAAWPDKIIVFGGANCEGEMGLELHRQFPFVDYVYRGDGDEQFPLLVEPLLTGEQPPQLPSLVLRLEGKSIALGEGATPVFDLDSLPFPDFTDYFEQLESSDLDFTKPSGVPFESSRGCWYGAKQQCTFCGLNGASLVYRSKTPERLHQEIIHLTESYGVQRLLATDNILDMRYFHDFIPSLAESEPDWTIFQEVKANLTKEQLYLLKRAGIDLLQAGIESLSTSILQLMRKGCTALQNVQMLKWGNQFHMDILWNLLTEIPGEKPGEYDRMTEIIPALIHLQPPIGFGRFRLDRFSPYFNKPEAFGLANLRAAHGYQIVYPFSKESLDRLAYYFDFDYESGQELHTYSVPLEAAVEYWKENHCSGALTCISNEQTLHIYDRRPDAIRATYELKGWEQAVYEYCDAAHSMKAIHRHLREQGYDVEEGDLRGLLEEWVEERLMLRDGDWFLSLAVPADDIVGQAGDSDVIKRAFAGALAEMADTHRQARIK